VNVSVLKRNATKRVNIDLKNVTQNVLDQKISNLCVPISVVTLLRFAMKNDLDFEDKKGEYSAEKILATLTLIVYPRSMAGLNLNPKKEEEKSQLNQIELLLKRLCEKTYFMETGWEIIRQIYDFSRDQPKKSTCKFEQGKIIELLGLFISNSKISFSHFERELSFHSSSDRHRRFSSSRPSNRRRFLPR
jgi:hypothetical protein